MSDNSTSKPNEKFLTESQVAALIRVSLSKLRQDRQKCRGIPYSKVGRAVRYSSEDVQKFMESHRITFS